MTLGIRSTAAILVTALLCGAAAAQQHPHPAGWCRSDAERKRPPPPRLNLPAWVCEAAHHHNFAERYDVHTRLNPFYLTADFNGDARLDAAVWVQHRRTRQVGLVVLHQGEAAAHTLGAGTPFGRLGSDFRAFDMWSVHPRSVLPKSPYELERPQLLGDALWLAKSASSTFFVYWNGRQYAAYQETD